MQWIRYASPGTSHPSGYLLMAQLDAGITIRRIRFSWGMYGDTLADTSFNVISQNLMGFGLVTTVGNGTEGAPNPLGQSADQDPPTQRWLWWEIRRPRISAYVPGTVIWEDSGPQEPTDAHGQVLATGLPAGDTLNLWASWALSTDWDTENWSMFVGASILVSTS
jgi:hypothetical protein